MLKSETKNTKSLNHQSMGMIGHFTVTGTTGIAGIPTVPPLFIKGNIKAANELAINYGVPSNSKVNLQLFDLLGKSVRTLTAGEKPADIYTETYSLADLKKGVYILQLEASDAKTTGKIILQ